MKTRTKLLLSAAVVAAFGGLAVASTTSMAKDGWHEGKRHGGYSHYMEGGRHHGHGMRAGMAMLETFDANDDGKLTQEEIDSGRAGRLAEFDADQDGQLNLEEFQALWLDAMRERMVDRFQSYDDDGDGVVTVEEFGEPFAQMVERMDRNDDGALSPDDRRKKHGKKQSDDDDGDDD